jgi:hypothetical protein
LGASLAFFDVCGYLGLARVKQAVSSADSFGGKGAQPHVKAATMHCLDLAYSLKIICNFRLFDGIFAS